jgi:hypothetical protein
MFGLAPDEARTFAKLLSAALVIVTLLILLFALLPLRGEWGLP